MASVGIATCFHGVSLSLDDIFLLKAPPFGAGGGQFLFPGLTHSNQLNAYVFATFIYFCGYELVGDAPMPRPMATYKRKILYREKDPKHRTTPKIAIPRWWIGDTEYVILRVYGDRIIVERAEVVEE